MTQQAIINYMLSGLLLLLAFTAYAAEITDLRISHSPDKTRVVFDFDQPIPGYNTLTLKDPYRLVFDFKNTQYKTATRYERLEHSLLDDIRVGNQGEGTLRVVFDMVDTAHVKIFTLEPQGSRGYRLVLDITGKAKPVKMAPKPATPATITEANVPLRNKNMVVVIDPGHGGKDPGAIGPSGAREKDVVLVIAKQLHARLNKMPGITAYLTRDKDVFLGLRDRTRIANKHNADLFISVHADAFTHARARGASVYALSQRGATSEAARFLAEQENRALGDIDLTDKDHVLRSVLLDLSQTGTINASIKVGDQILAHMGQFATLHKKNVEQAQFAVLKSPDIPSILVETGFISNPTEEKNLRSRNYQQKIVNAIAGGVHLYFVRYAPPGTIYADLDETREHIVAKGESLSVIAKHYGVTLSMLKSMNNLSSDRIRVGQTLLIPSVG